MEEFGPKEEELTVPEFGPTGVVVSQKSEAQRRADKVLYGTLFDVEPEMLERSVDTGADVELDLMAERRTEANKQGIVSNTIANREEQQDPAAVISALQEELSSIDSIKRFVQPSVVAMLSSPDPILRDYSTRRVKRILTAQAIIQDKVGSASEEGFWTNFDFVDYLLSSPQNFFTNQKAKEYSDRITELMYSSVSDEQFETELTNALTEMSDAGWFTEENRFYLNDFLTIFGDGSESNTAKVQDYFAALDTFGAAAGPVLTVATRPAQARAVATASVLTAGTLGRGALGVAQGLATDLASMVGFKTNDPLKVARILDEARIIDDPLRSTTNLANQQAPSIVTPTLMRPEYWSHTSSAAVRAFEEGSLSFREALKMTRQAGEAIDDAAFDALKLRLQQQAQAHAVSGNNKRYLDSDLVKDEMDNLYFQEFFGTTNGNVFIGNNGKRAAQNLADLVGGEVRQGANPNTFVVVKTSNLPVGVKDIDLNAIDVFTATRTDELGLPIGDIYLSSPLAQTTPVLNAVLKQGEAAREAWLVSVQNKLREVKALNTRTQQNEVFRVFDDLNSGSLSTRRSALTEAEFEVQFARLNGGRQPTDAQKAMYLRYQEALDTDAMFKADEFFKRQVADGVVVIDDLSVRVVPKNIDDLPANARIWDADANVFKSKADFPQGTRVYENYDGLNQNFPGDSRFMTGSNITTRRLYHSDVIARNAGGPRNYRKFDIGFFIKQDRTKKFADGSEVKVSPLTVMGVRTVEQAQDAANSLNTIIRAIRSRITYNYTDAFAYRNAVGSLANDQALNTLISQVSKWNPDVYDVNTLVRWADDFGVDLRKEFQFVRDGERLIDDDVTGGFAGMNYSRALDINALNPRARRDKVLMGYGGVDNRVLGAKSSIEKSLSRSVAINTERAYLTKAINGLLKTAHDKGVLENLRDLKGKTLKQKLMAAKIRDITEEGKKLALEQKRIMMQLDQKGLGDLQWEHMMRKVSDFLYSKKLRGADAVADYMSTNPLTALRGYVFDAKLGMFNPAQWYVQASQTFNVMAIGGWEGVRGAGLYGPIRFALANGNETVIRRVGELLEPISGINADQFLELVTMLKDSGRTTVGISLAEFGSEAAQASRIGGLVGEKVEAIRGAGRFFYNEGELVGRISAYATSYLELLKKYPTISPRSQEGIRFIMNRQDVLTQGMTGASRTPLDKLPFLQFMSYMFRVNEAMFSGTFGGKGRKVLTDAERYRLAVTHTALFGASAWTAAGFAMDWYRHNYGTDLDPAVYRAMRKGLVDTLITELTGVESSLSSRLSNSDGVFMLMKDSAEMNIFEFLGGPSIELGMQTSNVAWSALKNLAAAAAGAEVKNVLKDDVIRYARLFSSANQAYNAYTAFSLNQIMTRDNALLDKNVNDAEAIFTAFGVPIERIEEAWKYNTFAGYDKFFDQQTAKGIQRAYNSWAEAFDRGDFEEADSYMRVISMRYSTMTPAEKVRVDRLVYKPRGAIVDQIVLRAMQNESGFAPNYAEGNE